MDIELTKESKESLAAVAALKDMSPERLASRMLEEQIQQAARFEKEKAEDAATLEAMKNGDFITQEEMFSKMDKLAAQAKELSQNEA